MHTKIAGTGMYVPENVVDNQRLSRVMDTDDDWIVPRTGIRERRFARLDQASSDLAVEAARNALSDAGLAPTDVDYVVYATMTPDHYFPGGATALQHKLGLNTVPCLDIRQQCTGFIYGLQVADALLRSGGAETVLLVGAEVHGMFMPWKSWDVVLGGSDRQVDAEEYDWNTKFRDRTVLFGDGAGAFVLQRGEGGNDGLLDVSAHADGAHIDKMWVPAGGSADRPYFSSEMERTGRIVPIVQGREVFKAAVTLMPDAVNEILERNGLSLDEVRLLVMHQANLRINEMVQKRLGLDDDRVYNNIERYGNTTSATIPIAFHEARSERGLSAGDLVVLVAVGGGLTWGAALYRC